MLQLQESCRDSRAEAQELRQENSRLRHEFREREKYWRLVWQSRKPGQSSEDVPPLPPPTPTIMVPTDVQLSGVSSHSHAVQYSEDNITYRQDEPCSTPFSGSENSYVTSPSIPMLEPENGTTDDSGSRLAKFNAYSYSSNIHDSPRDSRWPMQIMVPSTESGAQTPLYSESPTLTTSEMSFAGYPTEDQKPALHGVLERASYTFQAEDRFSQRLNDASHDGVGAGRRSMSPTTSSTPTSATALTAPFQFNFSDPTASNDRREFDFRRHSLPHGELTLHGGTADITMAGLGPDTVRYRLNARKDVLGRLPGLVPGNEPNNSPSDRAGGDDGHALTSRLRRRRGTIPSSRSPSPGLPSMSCTVAVIKAQAFGALRRTRARGKKSSEGAAKVAMDVLEARGIGVGGPSAGSKRQRTDGDSMES